MATEAITIVTKYRCTSCDQILTDEQIDEAGPLYECNNCGHRFNLLTGDGTHRCDQCGKFAQKAEEKSCPDCAEEVEEITSYVCPECGEMHPLCP